MISRNSTPRKPTLTTKVGLKRHTPSPSPEAKTQTTTPRKKARIESRSNSDEGEEGEVEGMMVDDGPFMSSARYRDRAKQPEENSAKDRKDRREKAARRTEQLTRESDLDLGRNLPSSSRHSPPEFAGKRKGTKTNTILSLSLTNLSKVNSIFGSLRSNGHPDRDNEDYLGDELIRNTASYIPSGYGKRTRIVSPSSAKRDLDTRRLFRERKKQKRWDEEIKARRQNRDSRFLREVYTEIPIPNVSGKVLGMRWIAILIIGKLNPQGVQEISDDDAEGSVDDEVGVRNAAIAESRRKLAELEADRPLWEAVAARRAEEERVEQLQRARAQEERRAAAAAKAQQEKRQREEIERIAREEVEKRERARREKEKRQRQSWLYGKWSQQRAMEKYLDLSKLFDETKFSPEYPLTVDAIPWPVLQSPSTFAVEDVTWQAVEEFFEAFRSKMRTQDFKNLVEKSHRRFHPDRWRSRSLLTSVADEVERGCLEVGASLSIILSP